MVCNEVSFLAQVNPWASVDVGHDLFVFSPIIALVCTMLAVLACPIILGRSPRVIVTVALFGVITTLLLSLKVAGAVAGGGVSGLSTQIGGGILIADNLSICFQIILLVFMLGIIWLWWMGSAKTERNAPEFFVLLLGSALGMVLMVSTGNLLMVVLAIEMASLPSYALVGFDKRDRVGAEASLKYMVFGAISAAIMLYGASLLYGLVGSLNVADLAQFTFGELAFGSNRVLLSLGLLCFFAGICFKISAVPFHFWCPDAFEGAKIEVTTWLSVVSKAAGLILLTRLVLVFCSVVEHPTSFDRLAPLAWAIGIVAAVTCTVGNFAAFKQQSVKRLLAYSSIAHAGYMMMAAAVFVYSKDPGHTAGVSALLTYIIIYMFMNLGAFGVTALIVWDTGSDGIEAFTGLTRRAWWLAVPMTICLVSLVGIPPLAGFIGKWWVLLALGTMDTPERHYHYLAWALIVVMSLNTLISLFYYMRIVVQMALRDTDRPAVRSPVGGVALVNLCAVMLLVLFLFAHPLKATADRFSRSIFRPAATLTATATDGHETVAAAIDGSN